MMMLFLAEGVVDACPQAVLGLSKLDQGALGMSDPCGTLQLALKPNSVPRNNCLLTNFYFCAN